MLTFQLILKRCKQDYFKITSGIKALYLTVSYNQIKFYQTEIKMSSFLQWPTGFLTLSLSLFLYLDGAPCMVLPSWLSCWKSNKLNSVPPQAFAFVSSRMLFLKIFTGLPLTSFRSQHMSAIQRALPWPLFKITTSPQWTIIFNLLMLLYFSL